jgi:hypothetical protein
VRLLLWLLAAGLLPAATCCNGVPVMALTGTDWPLGRVLGSSQCRPVVAAVRGGGLLSS